MVQNLDFAPTFLDYAGIEIPKEIQGESFRKLVNGEVSESCKKTLWSAYRSL